jgi:hypothetical protein
MKTEKYRLVAAGIRDSLVAEQEQEIKQLTELAEYTLEFDEQYQRAIDIEDKVKEVSNRIANLEEIKKDLMTELRELATEFGDSEYYGYGNNIKDTFKDIVRTRVRSEYKNLHPVPSEGSIAAKLILEDCGIVEDYQRNFKDYIKNFK